MRTNHWTDRLSDYLDGDLTRAERLAADRHLSDCPQCAGLLQELRSVAAAAADLPTEAPRRDLWPGIRGRLSERGPAAPRPPIRSVMRTGSRRRIAMTVPQLVAAGIAVALVSAGLVWTSLTVPGVAHEVAAEVPPQPTEVVLAAYEPAMSDLESAYELRRGELDPEMVMVVERNLAIIDSAIREAGQALEADPSSGFLHSHLAATMRQRMDLLRQVARI